ncbi:MAG: site-2 protease family protein [Thermincola sp.]|jgi:Zn-dependent protease|nr:site-2 protease family protein [Thermincola sp.]MDT3703721.1 site-2 protease family protein [Thermincola sp.]
MPYFDLQGMLLTLPALLVGLTLHEFAHGYAAYRLGDPTAKNLGRLSFNPIKHLDPLGALFLLIFHFGWAKPVPVNPLYFRGDRQKGMMWVSLAGPVTNLVIAFVTALIWKIIEPSEYIIVGILFYLFTINIILAVFNLIPVPPLDGSKILAGILPSKYMHVIFNLEKYGYIILILLMFTGVTGMILTPLAKLVGLGITGLLQVESLKQIIMMSFR